MQKQQYQIRINAPAAQVYDTLLGLSDKATYEKWTAAFNPTSTYEGNWEKGSKMYFVGTDKDGKRAGMISEIADHVPNRFVSIRHYGMLDGDTEITEGEQVQDWAGSLENYTLEEADGGTTVTVEIDMAGEYQAYFDATWPKALEALKTVAEA